MSCEELKPMLTGYVDGELSAEQRARVEEHLAGCAGCRREAEQLRRLGEELSHMEFAEPSDEELERYWQGVYNRLERGVGWVLLSLGSIVLLCYGGFRLVDSLVRDPAVSVVLKVGVLALVFGAAVLFVSLLRERLAVRKVDRYSKGVKR